MSEQAPKVGHNELHEEVNKAMSTAQETTKRYSRVGNQKNYSESALSHNVLDGDAVSTHIERSKHPWFEETTHVDVHAQKPDPEVLDPYHRAGTDYHVRVNGQLGAHTKIERRNDRGEVVYTHESDDVQLARRIGMVGAKASVRQNTERAESFKKAA